MNSKEKNPAIIVDVMDIAWNLLSQWKAIVVFALIISLAITALKYNGDMNRYDAAIQEQAAKAETASVPLEDAINSVLDTLPAEDITGVKLLLNQREWIETESEYVNNSILLNVDPTNQRTLTLNYNISAANDRDEDLTSLVFSYSAYLQNEKVIDSIRNIIAPDKDNKYIAELLTAKNDKYNITYSNDANLNISVVLPEDTDAKEIEQVITGHLQDYSNELKKTICDHNIRLIQSDVSNLYNENAVKRCTDTMNSITALTNNANTMESALSGEQRAALNEITNIKKYYRTLADNAEAGAAANAEEIGKPHMSKKYMAVGFLLGILLYAFIYVLYAVSSNRVLSGNHIGKYVDSRVLGEIHQSDKKGKFLFCSKLVDKLKNHGNYDLDKQMHRILSSADAICKHAGVEDLSLFCVQTNDDEKGAVSRIAEGLKESGINSSIVDIGEEVDEKDFLSADNAVCVISEKCKVQNVIDIAQRFSDYDIKQIGYIYID